MGNLNSLIVPKMRKEVFTDCHIVSTLAIVYADWGKTQNFVADGILTKLQNL